jgi:hypothetical protein
MNPCLVFGGRWNPLDAVNIFLPFTVNKNKIGKHKEQLAMSEIKYEITKRVGVLSTSASGWSKEINLISWNDRDPKYDIRDWSANHEKMGKGVTLSKEELLALKELLNSIEL